MRAHRQSCGRVKVRCVRIESGCDLGRFFYEKTAGKTTNPKRQALRRRNCSYTKTARLSGTHIVVRTTCKNGLFRIYENNILFRYDSSSRTRARVLKNAHRLTRFNVVTRLAGTLYFFYEKSPLPTVNRGRVVNCVCIVYLPTL